MMTAPMQRLPIVQLPGMRRAAHSLPDAILALLFALAAAAAAFPHSGFPQTILESRNELYFAMYVEAGFLVLQVALVDMATRLDKQIPTGMLIAVAVGLTLFLGLPWRC